MGNTTADSAQTEERKTSVLWLVKGLGAGGAEHLLVSTARAADRERFDFSVAYVLNWKSALVDSLTEQDVPSYCLGVKDARDLRWVIRLRSHIKREDFDVIHVHSPLVAAIARLVLLTIRKPPPMMSTEHNSWHSHDRWTRLANRLTFRLDARHLAVSDQVVQSLPPSLQQRTQVILHGVDQAAIRRASLDRAEIRAELGIGDDQIAVCTVANLRWQKGYPDLMAAARQVVDHGHGQDVIFLAVGQGPLESELRERALELELGDQFRLLGYRSDAIRILCGSDIFALASLHEGYPLAIMEAAIAGLPIVATDVGGVPDAVEDGVEGILVPSSNPDALAAALIELIERPELRQRMGKAALVRGDDFDIGPAVATTQQIYEELMLEDERSCIRAAWRYSSRRRGGCRPSL